jgi:hypothetical protein
MIAVEARVLDVLEHAKSRFFAGLVTDTEALDLALRSGFVRNVYEGPAGFLGLAKLELTDAGERALLDLGDAA